MLNKKELFENSNYECNVSDLRIGKMKGFLKYLQETQEGVWSNKQINKRAKQFNIGSHWYKSLLEMNYAEEYTSTEILIEESEFRTEDIIKLCKYANWSTNNNSQLEKSELNNDISNDIKKEVQFTSEINQLKNHISELEIALEKERNKVSKLKEMI